MRHARQSMGYGEEASEPKVKNAESPHRSSFNVQKRSHWTKPNLMAVFHCSWVSNFDRAYSVVQHNVAEITVSLH
jgi:hypothetical protein